ncbi:MAG: hypothetical protein ACI9R3_004248 [Verrucomicrobiales bacterium]|jgi:hypothetical protein
MLQLGGSDGLLGGEIHTESELDIALTNHQCANVLGIVEAGMVRVVIEKLDFPVEWDVRTSTGPEIL